MSTDYHGPQETRKMIEQEHDVVVKVVQKLGLGKK